MSKLRLQPRPQPPPPPDRPSGKETDKPLAPEPVPPRMAYATAAGTPAPIFQPSPAEFRQWIENVIQGQIDEEIYAHRVGAALLALAACLATFITYWMAYLGWSVVMGLTATGGHTWRMVLSLLMVIGLFTWHFRRRLVYVTIHPLVARTGAAPMDLLLPMPFAQVLLHFPFITPPVFIGPLKYLALPFFLAPHLLRTAFYTWQSVARLQGTQPGPCAEIIILLAGFEKRVAVTEVFDRFPRLDPEILLRQLTRLEGVMFLDGTPPMLTLTDDFRRELKAHSSAQLPGVSAGGLS